MLDAPNRVVNRAELTICDDVWMTELDERLRECLREKGAKAVRLAEATGATRATVSEWLSGETHSISPKYLFPAAAWFGVSPTWLNTGKGPKHPPGLQDAQGHIPAEIVELAREIHAAPEPIQQAIRLILDHTEGADRRPRREVGREPRSKTDSDKKKA